MFRTTGWNIWPSLLGSITPDLPPFSILEQWEQCSGVDQKKPNKKVLFSQQEGAGSASVYAALIRGEKKVRQASHSGQTLVQICWKKKKEHCADQKKPNKKVRFSQPTRRCRICLCERRLDQLEIFFSCCQPATVSRHLVKISLKK